MALVALVSAKGSPGVTTAALAMTLTWPKPAIAVECDPAGGDVLAGYFRGTVPATAGLIGAASVLGQGHTAGDLSETLLALDANGTRSVLPGVIDPVQAAGLPSRWPGLATAFVDLRLDGRAVDVVADCGRLGAAYAPVPLLRRAHQVALVVRSSLPSVRAAYGWVSKLRGDLAAHGNGGDRLGLLLVGEGQPYARGEIAAHLGVPLLGVLAWDPKAAAVFSEGTAPGRGFGRAPLLRTARAVGARLSTATDNNQVEARGASVAVPPTWLPRDPETVVGHG